MSGRVAIKEICCAKIISILKVTAIEKRGEILRTCSKMGQIRVIIIIKRVDGEDGLQERRLIKGLSKEIFRLFLQVVVEGKKRRVRGSDEDHLNN